MQGNYLIKNPSLFKFREAFYLRVAGMVIHRLRRFRRFLLEMRYITAFKINLYNLRNLWMPVIPSRRHAGAFPRRGPQLAGRYRVLFSREFYEQVSAPSALRYSSNSLTRFSTEETRLPTDFLL